MRRFCIATVGVVLVAAAFAGCGGGDSAAAPGSGFLEDGGNAVPFKATDTGQFNTMVDQMKENAKKGGYKQKAAPPKEKDKAEKSK